jgi:GNAT superfamily N-acetyltransferase
MRRLLSSDAPALMRFYNGLSPSSKRLFHPMGNGASLSQCQRVCNDNTGIRPDRYDLVAMDGDHIVGWCFLWGFQGDRVSLGLGIADEYQHHGLGRSLLTVTMRWAKRQGVPAVHLTCVRDNVAARRLYESVGFTVSGQHIGDDGLCYVEMVTDLL